MTEHKLQYELEWKKLAQREAVLRTVAWLFFAAFTLSWLGIYAVGAAVFFVTDALGSNSLALQVILCLALVMGGIAGGWYFRNGFRCPRCRQQFFIRYWAPLPEMGDGSRCPHCGLGRDALLKPEV